MEENHCQTIEIVETMENEALKCSVCMEIFIQPTSLLCGHTFCRNDLLEWKESTCMICREPYELNLLKDNVILSAQVASFPMQCLVCKEKMLRGVYVEHCRMKHENTDTSSVSPVGYIELPMNIIPSPMPSVIRSNGDRQYTLLHQIIDNRRADVDHRMLQSMRSQFHRVG